MPNKQIQSLTVAGETYDIVDNTSGYIKGMTILSYGSSTWQDFITAYNEKKVVYCRASSQSNPASGDQTRLAFMAYVNNPSNPTSVEFQYYRSVSTHTESQQGDQVFVYTLTSAGSWSVTTREASVKVAVGGDLTGSYSSGTYTVSGDIPSISVSQIETSGVNIADVTIDGTTTHLYAPQGGGGGSVTSVGVSNATNGGLSVSGSPITSSGTISIGHSNVLSSAQTTQAVYPIKIDKNGHISEYGSAVTITDTKNTAGSTATSSKIYLVGATSQDTYVQTYSNSSLYYNNGLASFAQSGQNGSSILQIVQKVSLTATTSSNSSTIDVGSTGIDITYEDSQGNIAQGIYIDGLVTPTNDYQAATKAYVDNSVPLNTSNETTGITVSNHSTGSVTGVQSTTTTASKVTLGTAFSVPNVTAVGSGSASLTFEIDSTDSNQLNISFSHTHTAPTLGTAFSIPNVTGNSNVTVPIKNTSATTVVTSATHTVNDSGHYHDVGRYL